MQEKFAPKRDANAGDADEEIQAADAKLRADMKAEKREKKRKREDQRQKLVQPAPTALTVQVPEGFVLDESSGYFHNPATGQYYESNSKLYCCYNNGQWFYYDTATGKYKPWGVQASTDAAANTETKRADVLPEPAAAAEAEPSAEEAAAPVEPEPKPAEPEPNPVAKLEDESTKGFKVVEFGAF